METLQEIWFHSLSLMNSTYPSTIWDKLSASLARSEFDVLNLLALNNQTVLLNCVASKKIESMQAFIFIQQYVYSSLQNILFLSYIWRFEISLLVKYTILTPLCINVQSILWNMPLTTFQFCLRLHLLHTQPRIMSYHFWIFSSKLELRLTLVRAAAAEPS